MLNTLNHSIFILRTKTNNQIIKKQQQLNIPLMRLGRENRTLSPCTPLHLLASLPLRLHSNLSFHFIPFHSIPFQSILFHSIQFYPIPFYTRIQFYTIPFYSIPFHAIPFHSIPFHSILIYSIPFHAILDFTQQGTCYINRELLY